MIQSNSLPSERSALIAGKSGTATSTALVSQYFDCSDGDFRRFLATFLTGDMAAETIDCAIVKASDSSGTGVAVLKGATQLAAHATNNDHKSIRINLAASDIDAAKPFIAVRIVTGSTTGGDCGMTLEGFDLRSQRLEDLNDSDLVETVN